MSKENVLESSIADPINALLGVIFWGKVVCKESIGHQSARSHNYKDCKSGISESPTRRTGLKSGKE
jgi:hypothetical protein